MTTSSPQGQTPEPLSSGDYWPFGADLARHHLDPDLIEKHAYEVLYRSVTTGRLVVLAGAGLTMAYGRMTWSQLLESIFAKLSRGNAESGLSESTRAAWEKLRTSLWPGNSEVSFHKEKFDYPITAQLFDEFWGVAAAAGEERTPSLKHQAAADLGSSAARLGQIIRLATGIDATAAGLKIDRQKSERRPSTEFLDLLRPESQVPDEPAIKSAFERVFCSFLSKQASPLDILINGLGIKRFLTTNYDHEIEHALTEFNFPPSRLDEAGRALPGHFGTQHFTDSLARDTSAAAICLSADGSRRHAGELRFAAVGHPRRRRRRMLHR